MYTYLDNFSLIYEKLKLISMHKHEYLANEKFKISLHKNKRYELVHDLYYSTQWFNYTFIVV